MNKNLPYRNGIVKTKTHPELKFGQVVIIVEVTPDLYRVRLSSKSPIVIISIEDLMVTQ